MTGDSAALMMIRADEPRPNQSPSRGGGCEESWSHRSAPETATHREERGREGHRSDSGEKVRRIRVENMKGQVWSRPDQPQNRDLTHKAGNGEARLSRWSLVLRRPRPQKNAARLTSCLKGDLTSLHYLPTHWVILNSLHQENVNVNGLCIIKLAAPGIVLFLEVFTAVAGYSHLVGSLSRVVVHHSVDIQGLMALWSALSLHDKWMQTHTTKNGLVFTVSDV